MIRVVNDHQDQVISFYREMNKDAVLPILNFSDKTIEVNLDTKYYQGNYQELFTGKKFQLSEKTTVKLEPWSYLVLVKK